jgi:hypothetical protein
MVALSDKVAIKNVKRLADGRLVADARFARAGIYEYAGAELGRPELPVVRVYRSADEVFKPEAMSSFAHRAVTLDHPPVMVDAKNWKEYAHGISGDEVVRDGGYVRVPMMLCDAEAVQAVEDGKKELSAGYDAEIQFSVGTTDGGEHYDAVMRNIRGNHIAVVDKGRAGAECRIADADFEGVEAMNAITVKQILVDGLPFSVNDQAEAIIVKLQGQLKDANGRIETLTSEHAAAITAKDKELGERDATISDLKGKVIDESKVDQLVADRAVLIGDARSIVGDAVELKGTPSEVRRIVVSAKVGDAAVKDKSDDYVQALFDGLLANAKAGGTKPGSGSTGLGDALAGTLPGGGTRQAVANDAGKAYDEMRRNMSDAWREPTKDAATT